MSAVTDNNRKKLLKAASVLFSAKGFDAVSTRDLCSKADVNVAAISYYFGGKEGLYLEVFRENAMKMVEFLEPTLSPLHGNVNSVTEMAQALQHIISSIIEMRLQTPEIAIVLQKQAMGKIPGVREAFHEIMEPAGEELIGFFTELQEKKLIRADLNIRSFMTVMIESIWGYFAMQERGAGLLKDAYHLPEDKEKFAEFLSQLYTRGMQA